MATFPTAAQARAVTDDVTPGIKVKLADLIISAANAHASELTMSLDEVLSSLPTKYTPAQAKAFLENQGYRVSTTTDSVTISW